MFFFFFKQKTAYEMRISDWSSDVCSSDLPAVPQVKWEDSWGAIAIDDIRGEAGIVTGFPSKRKAKKAAIEECRKRGGEDCSISIIYTNQCAAVVSNSVRSEERCGGKEGVSKCRSGGSPEHEKKKKK